MKRKVLFFLILILMLVGLAEVVSYAAIRILQSKGLTYLPPAADESNPREFEEYLAKRDDELGWPDPKIFGGEKYDEEGGPPKPRLRGRKRCPPVCLHLRRFLHGGTEGC